MRRSNGGVVSSIRWRARWQAVAATSVIFLIGTLTGGPAGASGAPVRSGSRPVWVKTHGTRIRVQPSGRWGVFPTKENWLAAQARGKPLAPPAQLAYGGGFGGVGVTIGAPRVYIVYWGAQWGTASIVGGYTHLTGDFAGLAPVQQQFFAGLGTGGETWSGVMTQYCEGVTIGTTVCPASARHVGYPTGGALANVWADGSAPAPDAATAAQIAAEAVRAATHFGNTTAALNRNTQYVITSPIGTNPDGWLSNYCAYHSWTSSVDGNLAYTNMPYLPDVGPACGAGFVNPGPGGILDGVTIVGGHEYAETITDQLPSNGWTDGTGGGTGENADKCAWLPPLSGQGAAQDITLATGTFAVQSTWSNDFNSGAGGCEVTHPTVTDQPLVVNAGFENGTAAPWVNTGGRINRAAAEPPHTGTWDAWLGGHGRTSTNTLYQQVAVPSAFSSPTLAFWLHVNTADRTRTVHDTMRLQIRSSTGAVLATLATWSNRSAARGYSRKTFNLSHYVGQTIRIYCLEHENSSLQTSFVVDDFSLTVA